MKAAVHTTYGPPEVVHVTDVPRPAPRRREILIAVRATSVNRTDCGFRAGKPFLARFFTGLRRPHVTVMGCEFAGTVAEVGPEVERFAVGEEVFGYCEGPFGAHAEYLVVRDDSSVARKPESVPFDVAAVATEGAHYALSFMRWAKTTPGQRVLVNGATGAIGSAAVQILTHLGVHVTAVCGTAHQELVRGLGAERVIDYQTQDFAADDLTYDAVYDTVGTSTFWHCRRLLKPRGRYLSSEVGPGAQNLVLPLPTLLLRRRRVLFPVPRHDRAMIEHIADLLDSGDFSPVIDRHYPLEKIRKAYEYVESRQKVGNVVVDVAD